MKHNNSCPSVVKSRAKDAAMTSKNSFNEDDIIRYQALSGAGPSTYEFFELFEMPRRLARELQ